MIKQKNLELFFTKNKFQYSVCILCFENEEKRDGHWSGMSTE